MNEWRTEGQILHWDQDLLAGELLADGQELPLAVNFAHFTALPRVPVPGDRVQLSLAVGDDGQPQLAQAQLLRPQKRFESKGVVDYLLIAFALGYLGYVFRLVRFEYLPWGFLVIYVGASGMAMWAYWMDRQATRRGLIRAKDSTLHTLALMGGWPGALIAQRLFRNKLRKRAFQDMFWFIVALHLGLLGVLLTDSGRMMLYNLLGI